MMSNGDDKKHMKKNIITFILVGITVLSIYGCGKEILGFLEAIEATLEESEETYRTPEQTEIQQPEAGQRQWQVYIQPDMPEPFIEVLKQYEEFMNTDIQILNEDAWWDEFNTVDGERGDLLWELCGNLMSLLKGSAEESDIESYRYSLTDLTGDGFPELIMGYYSDLFDEDYLYAVYYYSETEGIKMEYWSSYFSMSLYEDGIIEYISGGMDYTMRYYRFQEETESWEQAACIIVDWEDDRETYYWGVNTADFSDPDNKPMSEEEYNEIIEKYTAKPVELEWIPMFCGEALEDEAEAEDWILNAETHFNLKKTEQGISIVDPVPLYGGRCA